MKEPGTEAGLDAAWELGLGFGGNASLLPLCRCRSNNRRNGAHILENTSSSRTDSM